MRKEGLKGRLFEALIKKLIKKAGFCEFSSEELTKRSKFHGRGATHQVDVWGEFCFAIPFVYPLNVLGEVKAYKGQTGLAPVRNFLGVYKDISEFYRIDTHSGGTDRYSRVGRSRHTHCPVFFSLNGFSKNAEEYMYAQGINPITYENNFEINRIYKKFSGILRQINFKKLTNKDYGYFKELDSLPRISEAAKKEGFEKRYKELLKYLTSLNSYLGMIGGKYITNITTKKNFSDLDSNATYELSYNKSFKIKRKNQAIGEFSISRQFIKYYLHNDTNIKKVFSYIDVFILNANKGEILKIKFSPDSLTSLTKTILNQKQ